MPFPATHASLALALAAQGYDEPTPVQAAVLEASASGRDLLVSAQTGSGKTVAFGLAAAETLLGEAPRFERAGGPLALVIAPTRELAAQVARELSWLYAETGAITALAVGGADARREQRALAAGAHLLVGTPGRLRDHLERGNLDLSGLKLAVLDEADEMLDLGFREDLEAILDATPAERRTLLFSATLAKEITGLARRYQRDALRIDTTTRNAPHGDIEYRVMRVAPTEVEHAVVNVLRRLEAPGALVFCATRERVRHLYAALRERGFAVVGLSGELSQKERTDALQALRDGHARVCVATDVAARGLDLPELSLVIHADLPANREGLLHRSGRTGRAGRKGTSVILAPHTKRRRVEQLLALAHIDAVWSGPPTAQEIRAADEARLLADPILSEPAGVDEAALAARLLSQHAPQAVAAALIRMLRTRLPEPEELIDDAADARDARRGPGAPPAPRKTYDPLRAGGGDAAWFRLSVGRKSNADPKWLIPLICRLGHVTKTEIGEIRIFDKETKFQIAGEAAGKFLAATRAAAGDGDVRIEPAGAPGGSSTAGRGGGRGAAGPPRGRPGQGPAPKAGGKRKRRPN